MLNLESRIKALGSIEAEFSHHKLVFSTSRKEEEKNPLVSSGKCICQQLSKDQY